jgi:BirA family transcriptional regulator, biotin operon repressor / biotin---[acetyl-CoA-carboxylase] ligase
VTHVSGPGPYSDLERPPLREAALARALITDTGLWRKIRVVDETASTNADVVAAAGRGAAEGMVLVAESQTAGRGRLNRSWVAPPRSGLTFSVLLRPQSVAATRWAWLPLLTGVAVARAVSKLTELDARLKWPNDILVPDRVPGLAPAGPAERKVAGILVERAGNAAVVGIGLNVSTRVAELPVETATSLALAGAASTDRDPLLRAILRELATAYQSWQAAAGDPAASGLREAYRERCATLGRPVRVQLPDGATLAGDAVDIDDAGRLVVRGPDGEVAVGAGDVVHVR